MIQKNKNPLFLNLTYRSKGHSKSIFFLLSSARLFQISSSGNSRVKENRKGLTINISAASFTPPEGMVKGSETMKMAVPTIPVATPKGLAKTTSIRLHPCPAGSSFAHLSSAHPVEERHPITKETANNERKIFLNFFIISLLCIDPQIKFTKIKEKCQMLRKCPPGWL